MLRDTLMTSTGPDDRLALRPREAARLLSVSERTLFTWTKSGVIPHARVGRTILYSTDGLRNWLAERAAEATR